MFQYNFPPIQDCLVGLPCADELKDNWYKTQNTPMTGGYTAWISREQNKSLLTHASLILNV